MTLDRHERSRLSRRALIAWSGIGAIVGSSLVAACRGGAPTLESSPPSATRDVASAQPTARPMTSTPIPTNSVVSTANTGTNLNYLHTDGGTIRDASGREVILSGLNWFGLETDNLAPHGLWARGYKSMLDQIAKLDYNCLRLPFSNELFDANLQPNGVDYSQNADLKGLNGLEIMDRIIVEAGKRGLKIILDQHRPTTDSQSALWYTVELTQAEWIDQWKTLAQRYLGNDAVIGADLHNEPSGDCTWGSGDPLTDWAKAAETCGNEILKVNPNWLIFVEGIEKIVDKFDNVMDWTWQGGELIDARVDPVKLAIPGRLVYSSHDYGPSVYNQGWFSDPKFPDNLPSFWDFHWGYLQKQGIAPLLVGEFGGPSVGTDPEGVWQRRLVDYLKVNRIHYTYWAFNANSADTGGLLEPDWKTVNVEKQDLLKSYLGATLPSHAPDVVNTSAVPKVSPNRLPVKALHFDDTAAQWIPMLKPELYVMNKTLDAMDLSGFELRYWFAPNGDANPNAHQVQIRGTSTTDFGKVLSGDAVKAEVVSDTGVTFGGNPLYYIKITFAPGTSAPKRDCVGFGLQVQKKDGSQYYQPSHYSYRDYHWPSEWERIGLYRDGKLVWGMEPQTYEADVAAKQRAVAAQLKY